MVSLYYLRGSNYSLVKSYWGVTIVGSNFEHVTLVLDGRCTDALCWDRIGIHHNKISL